jgi:hypothetical protein
VTLTPEEAGANRARLDMVHQLHAAIYGNSWARPESPKEVWDALLREVARLAHAGNVTPSHLLLARRTGSGDKP